MAFQEKSGYQSNICKKTMEGIPGHMKSIYDVKPYDYDVSLIVHRFF